MNYCVQVHAHVEADCRFTAFLKAASALLAVIMGRPHGCDKFYCGAEDMARPEVAPPEVTDIPDREDMH